jgi:hypothetical protein
MNCIYCGKRAGWFRSSHIECREQNESGRKQVAVVLKEYMFGSATVDELGQTIKQIQNIADRNHITANEIHLLAIAAFNNAVDAIVEDHVPLREEQGKLASLKKEFSLTQEELGSGVERLYKVALLADLDEGNLHPRDLGDLPIKLLKDEKVIWLFGGVESYETKTTTTYVGGSHGVSVRLVRGVYYRVGASKGERIQTNSLVHSDTGLLIVTSRHVYFHGSRKSYRIRLDKIVSVVGYSDGIGLMRESANPAPLCFKLDDPWFATNLILKLGTI